MRLSTSCEITFEISAPTPFMLMLRARSGAQQSIKREEYRLTPSVPVYEFTDQYGNLCQRLVAPEGQFEIYTAAEITIADQVDQSPGAPFVQIQSLPDTTLIYLLPSRYCESDYFGNMATEIVSGTRPGYDQVVKLIGWVRQNIAFQPGSSTTAVSATEVNTRKFGVCRDMAHLGIALCRSIGIPARLVVGYLYQLEPMDLHAWFEAYVGDRWYTFDPTQEQLVGGYASIGYGRDAADVAIYNQFGPPVYPVAQTVRVVRAD